jgi:hypothetical protein
MKIVDYIVVDDTQLESFRQIVLDMIDEGYEPIGGIVSNTVWNDDGIPVFNYLQAMVKKEYDS